MPRSAEQQIGLDAAMIDLFENKVRFNQVLGLKVLALRPHFRARLDMRADLVGHFAYGRLHGGVISSMLDAMGGSALLTALTDMHPADSIEQALHRFLKIGTIDLRVDYLRQGIGRHFIGTAEITRLGGRVGSTQVRLVNDEEVLIATASAAYIVS